MEKQKQLKQWASHSCAYGGTIHIVFTCEIKWGPPARRHVTRLYPCPTSTQLLQSVSFLSLSLFLPHLCLINISLYDGLMNSLEPFQTSVEPSAVNPIMPASLITIIIHDPSCVLILNLTQDTNRILSRCTLPLHF